MVRKVRLLLTLLLLLSVQTIYAQTGKLFDTGKQLSSSFINQVYLDSDGFLWAATRNGLNKYDGYQFQNIMKEQERYKSMATNYVNCIIQDKSGLFYLGMYGAFQTFDGNTFRNIEVKDLEGKTVPCYITSLLLRKNGEILAGTSGHGLLKVIDRQHAQQQNSVLRNINTVNDIAEDTQGHIWIATDNEGLIEYDGKTAKKYFTSDEQRNTIIRIGLDKEGNIYVGTSKHGAYIRHAKGGEFQHIDVTGNRHVSAIHCNNAGKMMMGFDGQGVGVFDPKTGKIEDNPFYSREVDLSKSKVHSMIEDHNGNVWLGLMQKGIFMQPKEISAFRYMGYKLGMRNVIGQACVISTYIDSRGRCWVGTDKDGVYCLDYHQQPIKHLKENFPASVLNIIEDKNGRIWVGSYGEGFGYIDADAKAYHKFPQFPSSSGFGFVSSSNGEIWVATMGQGLLRIDPSTNLVKAYTMDSRASSDSNINSIANDYISKISISEDGKRIYLATTMGVCCLDIEKESWTSFFGKNCLNYGTPIRTVKEHNGVLWIGTYDGLDKYDIQQKKLKRYTIDNGIVDNGIASIEFDQKGRVWLGTDHGLCCLDPKTDITQNFFTDNGLQSNEFSDGASCTVYRGDNSDVMLFGGVGGITWFHPERVMQKPWNASVKLVSFIVNQQPINSTSRSGSYQICDTTVMAANHFQLAAQDNHFAIRLSTLSYDNPEHISYLYSINGEPYTRLRPGVNELTFTHLAPGTYRFRIKAIRNQMETPEKVFTVVVHAPWYRSAWAYTLYLIALGILVWQFLQNRKRKEQTRLRMQEHIHAEQMSDAKLRFFMNISHEIRTPMTLIVTPLLSLIKNEKDPQRKRVYETIKRNSERILSLINQMMDLRKIDKGQMQMRMAETDLIPFIKDIYELFDNQARSKQLKLTFEHDTESLPAWIDRRNFDKIIVNILSNAFKFTPTGGEIGIHITHDDKQATIAISDNGEKIPEDKLEKIFERFYQTTSSVNDRNTGTGIGLDLTRSLVELHHGTIEARNLQQGCEFIVSIPLGNAHLKPDEMIIDAEAPASEELLPAESNEVTTAEEVTIESATDRITLVIAEDDDEIRNYLGSELGRDYDVHLCINGREALAETLRTKADLVISDIMMPEMDGNTLCSKIKSNPSINHIPVILLTAKNRDEDKLEGLETGADAYIVKPFNMDILRHTISNLINTHRMLQLKYGRNDNLEEQVDEVKMKSPDEKLLDRVMQTINSHLDDSDLSVDMIADEVGISRVHLHRKMKELTGQTPHDFIRNIRLKQAANLLANQGMNVTEVMYACGFANSASFSTVFKKFYGMSPRDYMKEHYKQGH